jgi:hypothetical protein
MARLAQRQELATLRLRKEGPLVRQLHAVSHKAGELLRKSGLYGSVLRAILGRAAPKSCLASGAATGAPPSGVSSK